MDCVYHRRHGSKYEWFAVNGRHSMVLVVSRSCTGRLARLQRQYWLEYRLWVSGDAIVVGFLQGQAARRVLEIFQNWHGVLEGKKLGLGTRVSWCCCPCWNGLETRWFVKGCCSGLLEKDWSGGERRLCAEQARPESKGIEQLVDELTVWSERVRVVEGRMNININVVIILQIDRH